MSGGSYDYAYCRADDMADRLSRSPEPLRRAFGEHLRLVAKAMHDIEWVDSCDYGPGDEVAAIRAVVNPAMELREAITLAEQAQANLNAALIFAKPAEAVTL